MCLETNEQESVEENGRGNFIIRSSIHLILLQIEHILTERDILARTNSPWLVRLLYAFQDVENVYLAMEYVPGGDMRTLFNNSGCLKEEHARFYIAEMFMCVSELHRLGYIHRFVLYSQLAASNMTSVT